MSYCPAGSRVSNLHSEFNKHVEKTNARQDKLEAQMIELNKKMDRLLSLLEPQQVPKRDLRKTSPKVTP